jgi:hypothetical protein
MKTRRYNRAKPWVKQNQPPQGEPWIWLTIEMLESPAWRALSGAAQKIVFRVAIEHMGHAGTENGNLVVTYDQFADYGVRRSSIARAIREAEHLGWIRVVQRGRGGNSEFRRASRYALAWLPTADGLLAGNAWKRFAGSEPADMVLLTRKARSKRWQSLAA